MISSHLVFLLSSGKYHDEGTLIECGNVYLHFSQKTAKLFPKRYFWKKSISKFNNSVLKKIIRKVLFFSFLLKCLLYLSDDNISFPLPWIRRLTNLSSRHIKTPSIWMQPMLNLNSWGEGRFWLNPALKKTVSRWEVH